MSEVLNSKKSVTKKIAFTAIFAALCCLATFIAVPLPIGYFNLGDVFVLLSGWCLGPVYGLFAAGVGSALTDICLGAAMYAPATLVIKALMAVVSYYVFKALAKVIRSNKLTFASRAISAVVAECIMVGGYFFYEAVVLGYGMGATASLLGNTLQGVCGTVCATILVSALSASKAMKRNFDL